MSPGAQKPAEVEWENRTKLRTSSEDRSALSLTVDAYEDEKLPFCLSSALLTLVCLF